MHIFTSLIDTRGIFFDQERNDFLETYPKFIKLSFAESKLDFQQWEKKFETMKEGKYLKQNIKICTMLQKLSKCEVKVHSVEFKNLIATQFYVKSILAKFESQKLPFCNFRHSKL